MRKIKLFFCQTVSKRLLTDSRFVEFLDYFGRFSTSKIGGYIRKLILPPNFESKIGSKEPKNQQKVNPLTVSIGRFFATKSFAIASALLLALAALMGCATAYQKEGLFTNGYSDFRSSDDQFVLTFRASEHTPAEKVLEYALGRAAELTVKHGFRYFSVLDKVGKGAGLHYPSVRLTIQCYHSEPVDREWIDAVRFIHPLG